MNISDLNNKIYGYKELKDGEHANFIINSIEEKQIINFNSDKFYQDGISNRFNGINKGIKF